MRSREIRSIFLDYFRRNGHAVVSSSPLVPGDDPTLLFTNAGMNQFKDTFLGRERRDYTRAASSQKCMRVSGKHNDLDNVGPSLRHHTIFKGENGIPRDDEAFDVWRTLVPSDRIMELGADDNFWQMGETGPCGRCS